MTARSTAFGLGIVSGLRTTVPAAVGAPRRWALGLAAGEMVADKLPIGSRTSPGQFAARLASGGLAGAARGEALAGMAGAVAGTLGGALLRRVLARALRAPVAAGLVEDALAVAAAAWLFRRGGSPRPPAVR